jgi:putative ABC transport system permease protein
MPQPTPPAPTAGAVRAGHRVPECRGDGQALGFPARYAERCSTGCKARWLRAWWPARVAAPGAPLAVMDIGAAQDLLGRGGSSAASTCGWCPGPTAMPAAPAGAASPLLARRPDAGRARRRGAAHQQPVARLPRQPDGAGAGGAVHRGIPGVLGAGAERGPARAAVCAAGRAGRHGRANGCAWCWPNRLLLGVAGSLAGMALGTGLAWLALRLLGGDLGGGYFAGAWCRRCSGTVRRRWLYGAAGRAGRAGRRLVAGTRRAAPATGPDAQGAGAAGSRGPHALAAAGAAGAGRRLAGAGLRRSAAWRWPPMWRSRCCWWAASARCRR